MVEPRSHMNWICRSVLPEDMGRVRLPTLWEPPCRPASKRAREKGFAVMFAAADLIAQKPKLAPHIPAIRASVAKMLDVPAELVNISAKTAEKQGTIGGGKAIACDATVTLMKID